MNNKIKLYCNRLRGLFPEALPVGVTAFDAYVDAIMSTYSLPTQDRDSVKYAIATRILGFGPMKESASKYSFVLNIRAACAKQIAGNAFQQIKEAQKARQLAEAQSSTAATVTPAADAQPL